MKNLWKKFLEICESLGRARAATVLARHGHYELAKQMMLKD
jgi:hypothetical protein